MRSASQKAEAGCLVNCSSPLARLHGDARRQPDVGLRQPPKHFLVLIGDEDHRRRRDGEKGRKRCQSFVARHGNAGNVVHPHRHRHQRADRLQRCDERARHQADQKADIEFAEDQPRGGHQIHIRHRLEHDRQQHRRHGEGGGDRHQKPDAHVDAVAGKTGDVHHARPDPAKEQEGGHDGLRPDCRDQELAHDTLPIDVTSTPRAISRCESTGRVGNIRSTIIRT